LAGQGHRPALTAVPHRGTRPQVRAADGSRWPKPPRPSCCRGICPGWMWLCP